MLRVFLVYAVATIITGTIGWALDVTHVPVPASVYWGLGALIGSATFIAALILVVQ